MIHVSRSVKLFLSPLFAIFLIANGFSPVAAQENSPAEEKAKAAAAPKTEATTKDARPAAGKTDKKDEKQEVVIPPPPTPQILQPYRVRVIVSFEADPMLPATMHSRTLSSLKDHLQAQYHQMWELDVKQGQETSWISDVQLKAFPHNWAPEDFLESEYDKIFLVTLSYQEKHYTALVREWDASSRTLGSLHSATISDRREFVATLGEGISEAFRPLAELEVVNDEKIEFLVRGGEFLPRNQDMQQFQVGDYLVPYLRYLNRKREVQKIQELPWTYMKVESVERSRISLSVTSAFGNPIAGKRRRVEIMAMRIRPHLDATEIMIYPRGEKQNPLVGYRCEVMDRFPSKDDPVDDRLKLETDRRGIVTVPVVEKSPLQFLYVHSGQALLAKVPFIPGYSPLLEVEVPDDTARLSVEGEVALLQSELIDIIATREVLMARTRVAAKAKRWDDVGKFLAQLQALPTQEQFVGRIDSLQVRAVQKAKIARDRVAEIRVKRLCDGISDAATKHLDPFRIAEFRREMNEDRQNSK
ncbi:hypothetical protein [Thalassoglobus sp.]|uniref:hypothetical protein n=1 Tax=Thalassoglobus sp. TaxID=2795869 RepID=UPI003AA7C3C8